MLTIVKVQHIFLALIKPILQHCIKHCVEICKSTKCFKTLPCVDLICSQVDTSYVTLKHISITWSIKSNPQSQPWRNKLDTPTRMPLARCCALLDNLFKAIPLKTMISKLLSTSKVLKKNSLETHHLELVIKSKKALMDKDLWGHGKVLSEQCPHNTINCFHRQD